MIFLVANRRFRVGQVQLYLFILFWLIYTVRILNDTILHGNQLGFPTYQYYLFGIILSFFCSIPLFAFAPVNEIKLEWQVLVISFLLTVLALYNSLTNEDLFVVRVGGNERLNPITTGVMATLPILISMKKLFFRGKKNLLLSIFYFTCIIVSLITLLIVSTKVMFICIGLLLLLMIIHLFYQMRLGTLAGIFLFFSLIIIVVIYGGYGNYFSLTLYRFTDINQDESSQLRIDFLHGAINQFFDSPIWGSFLEEKKQKVYPHNLIVESFMATGFLGGTLFFIYYLIFFFQSIFVAFKSEFGPISILAACGFLMALTSSALSFSSEFWYISAIISWMVTTDHSYRLALFSQNPGLQKDF
jgi:hypothetical protein